MRECDNWIIRNNYMLTKFIEDMNLRGLIHEVWNAAAEHQKKVHEQEIHDNPESPDIDDLVFELTESINPKNI
jgi:hypothetical protein